MIIEAAKKAKIDNLLIERNKSPVGPMEANYQEAKSSVLLWLGLFKPAPILILDEALALDAVTEANI